MNKLSQGVRQRLVAQAEEAKELQLEKLASDVLSSVGSVARDEGEEFTFSYEQLKEGVHQSLWKIAVNIIAYHDANRSDIQKVDLAVSDLTEKVLAEVERSLNVLEQIGPHEAKLPGQS